ncbi:MAG TPA: ABC transporter substrate-binding protein [Thermomicrobiales bacterium]|nr:ABC transporter substrate-binding protein [Thermomicrobiales bacterium]
MQDHRLSALMRELQSGALDRRAFVQRATALGVSASAAGMIARSASAQDASPAASPAASPVAGTTRSITRDEYLAWLREQVTFEEAENEGGEIILASTTDISTLNPVTRGDVVALLAIGNLFNTLAFQNPIDGTMVPDLADYWEVADDGVTYTFYLNQNATWHDGVPVTADDVVMTFDAVMSPDSASPLGSEFTGSVASYRAIDEHTFEIVSLSPMALFLEKTVAAIQIMPKHIWGEIPFAEWGSAPGSTGTDPSQVIGSGPFRFVEWVLGSHVTIERNPDYWLPDRVPHIDRFTIRVIADPNSALQSLLVGESDTFRGLAPTQVDAVKESGLGLELIQYDSLSWSFFLMNADKEKQGIFTDVNVRRAMMYAVDRDLIVDSILDGLGTPAVGVQPPGSPAYAPEEVTTVYTYDPELASSMLEESGWVDADGDGVREKDGVKFSMEFLYIEGVPIFDQLIPYLLQVFGEVGVEVIPQALPQPTLMERVLAGDFELSMMSITWTLDDLGVLYRCDAMPPAGFNLARHCNEEYDRLNTLSLGEMDPEKRRQLIIDQGNVSNDDAHYGLLTFGKAVVPVNPRARNVFYSPYGELWSLSDVWVRQE